MSPCQPNCCSSPRQCSQTAYKWKLAIFVNSPVSKPASNRLCTFPNEVKFQTFKNGTDQEAGSRHRLNITLTASLVPLANEIPGPGPSQPLKVKGLRILDINICSLRNKLTELRLFCDKHRTHLTSFT